MASRAIAVTYHKRGSHLEMSFAMSKKAGVNMKQTSSALRFEVANDVCLASSLLMVRPAKFAGNPETASSNRFQDKGTGGQTVADMACAEFDAVANALSAAGVDLVILDDSADPAKPDAVFPNNWMSTHPDGTVVLYPMLAVNRRSERRPDLCVELQRHGRTVTAVLDLSPWEARKLALEGTGSLVLDRRRRVAYACRSPRTAEAPLAQWARYLGYSVHLFDALDRDRVPIYHTNVMMALGSGFAVAALDAVSNKRQQHELRSCLEQAGDELITISSQQMGQFGANILHLAGTRGPVIAMSETARRTLEGAALARLERHGSVVAVSIPTIERYGGGSVRCMLAELFLPTVAA